MIRSIPIADTAWSRRKTLIVLMGMITAYLAFIIWFPPKDGASDGQDFLSYPETEWSRSEACVEFSLPEDFAAKSEEDQSRVCTEIYQSIFAQSQSSKVQQAVQRQLRKEGKDLPEFEGHFMNNWNLTLDEKTRRIVITRSNPGVDETTLGWKEKRAQAIVVNRVALELATASPKPLVKIISLAYMQRDPFNPEGRSWGQSSSWFVEKVMTGIWYVPLLVLLLFVLVVLRRSRNLQA